MRQAEVLDGRCDTYDIQFGHVVYKYYLYDGGSDHYLQQLRTLEDIDSFLFITDDHVAALYATSIVNRLQDKYKCDILTITSTETQKNMQVLGEIMEQALSLKVTRRTCIVALGGGICGNLAGMVAALLFRGIKLIHMPTTLMAISDSVLSLKQAINSTYGKNLIGTFYTPEMVIGNIDFLRTLPRSEIVSGLCEVVKNALTILPESIPELRGKLRAESGYNAEELRYFIDMSIQAKTRVMQYDPFEKKEALVLEYGHTTGHAIELAEAGNITHGEAIGLGMICAAEVSRMLGYLSDDDVQLHRELLAKAGASIHLPRHLQADMILSIMQFDNKRGYVQGTNGMIHMVLLQHIGKPLMNNSTLLTEVPEELVRQAMINLYE